MTIVARVGSRAVLTCILKCCWSLFCRKVQKHVDRVMRYCHTANFSLPSGTSYTHMLYLITPSPMS